MKNRYGISFFILSIVFLVIITCAYQLTRSYTMRREEQETKMMRKEQALQGADGSVAAEGTALKEDCFYLMEVNGYVVVYLSDRKTPYEYTDILYDELPETIRNEVRNGKYIESIEALYGFLENYSS